MKNKRISKIADRAKEVISNNEKVKILLSDVKDRIDKINNNSEERTSFVYQVQVIVRMLRAYYKGEYSAFSTSTILMLAFGLVYFITPIDLIPDFIPGLGLTDDISIIYMIFKSFADDITRFRRWEKEVLND